MAPETAAQNANNLILRWIMMASMQMGMPIKAANGQPEMNAKHPIDQCNAIALSSSLNAYNAGSYLTMMIMPRKRLPADTFDATKRPMLRSRNTSKMNWVKMLCTP